MAQTTFRPENGPFAPDTLVVSYYPLGGNDGNTGPRYQQEADITGFDILGITREGSDTTVKNAALRDDFSPARFDDMWASYAGELDESSKDYDYIIVRGQSTGSFPALNIVKNGLIRATHLVIEDGINLRLNRHGKAKGPVASRLDWAVGFAGEALTRPQPPDPNWAKPQGKPTTNGLEKFRAETYHWAPLWRSNYSRRASLEIARTRPDLPMVLKFLGHTATSTSAEVNQFFQKIDKIEAFREKLRQPAATIVRSYLPDAWHSVLEYPEFGAANLLEARSLESFVTRQPSCSE